MDVGELWTLVNDEAYMAEVLARDIRVGSQHQRVSFLRKKVDSLKASVEKLDELCKELEN